MTLQHLVLMATLTVSSVGAAQSARPATEVVFEDDLIEGTSLSPDLEVVSVDDGAKHPSLLTVRTDFRDKALASVSEL